LKCSHVSIGCLYLKSLHQTDGNDCEKFSLAGFQMMKKLFRRRWQGSISAFL
jgi:hypothetical protein